MIFHNLHKIFAAAAFTALVTAFFSISAAADSVIVTADVLNVRSEPTTGSVSLTKAHSGDNFTLLESLDGWYHIRTQNGTEGYISAEYAHRVSCGCVNATVLRVHSSTGINSPVVGRLVSGTVVELLTYDGSWYKIKSPDGLEGYVSAEYIISQTSDVQYGYVTADSLRVHSEAGISAPVIGSVSYNDKLELSDFDGSWYKIKSSDGLEGYVSADYISLTAQSEESPSENCGYVDATLLNVRSIPGMDSEVVDQLVMGTKVKIIASADGWHYIEAPGGTKGYVSLMYISETPIEESIISAAESTITRSDSGSVLTDAQRSLGEAIVATAKDYLGTPYVYSAAGPDSFDCSGFTMFVMDKHGISLPHQSASQSECGYEVALDELAAGDLVFFNTTSNSGVGHVGIYIGDGKFIHASSGSIHAVTVSSLGEDYYSAHYLGARRVI